MIKEKIANDHMAAFKARDHMWINDEAVVIIADYIERNKR